VREAPASSNRRAIRWMLSLATSSIYRVKVVLGRVLVRDMYGH
jgi:hypothetical protein